MWICALKTAMSELKIFGPSGDPNAPATAQQVTLVPWETFQAASKKEDTGDAGLGDTPRGKWQLADKNTVMVDPAQDVFGETNEVRMNCSVCNTLLMQDKAVYDESEGSTCWGSWTWTCSSHQSRPGPSGYPSSIPSS
jgi:hypothetical protein